MGRYLLFLAGILLLTGLACEAFGGAAPETDVDAGPTAVATPTIRPTDPPDPFAELTPTASPAANEGALPTPTLAGAAGETDGAPAPGDPSSPPAGHDPDAPPPDDPPAGDAPPGDAPPPDSAQPVACPAPGQNLLRQGDFAGPYEPHLFIGELSTPPPWVPWWIETEGVNFRPEFKPADGVNFPNRVRSGTASQQYFKSHGQFVAGLLQQVSGVQPGQRLQFSAYGMGWSCEDFSQCGDGSSFNPANMLMRVGINPHGSRNHLSHNIVWSEYFNPIDRWEVRCVETVAQHDVVTVFLWASPDGPRENQDVYWDDASLVVLP